MDKPSPPPFEALSIDQQRVAIAQDVLNWLAAGRLQARRGTYLFFETPGGLPVAANLAQTELRDVLRAKETCEVCAIGACFVAAVDRHDALKADVLYGTNLPASSNRGTWKEGASMDHEMMRTYLGQWFEQEQLALMENAFEGSDVNSPEECRLAHECEYEGNEYDGADLDGFFVAAVNYNDEYRDSRVRLERVMRNVVRNGGTFNPKDKE